MSGDMCHWGQITERLQGKEFPEYRTVFEWAREAYPCCADRVRNYYVYQYQLQQARAYENRNT